MPDKSIKDKVRDMIRYAENDPQTRGWPLRRHALMADIYCDNPREYDRRTPPVKREDDNADDQ